MQPNTQRPGANRDVKQEIQSTKFAFAALCSNGSVVAWGEASLGRFRYISARGLQGCGIQLCGAGEGVLFGGVVVDVSIAVSRIALSDALRASGFGKPLVALVNVNRHFDVLASLVWLLLCLCW